MNSGGHRDFVLTKKIMSEIEDVEDFVRGLTEEEYIKDIKTQKAVVMSLVNIGELSKAYTDEFLEKNSSIPWSKIQAMRNIAAHKYEIIDPSIVWDTVKISLPELKQILRNE